VSLRTRLLGILRAEPLIRTADRMRLRVRPGSPANPTAVLIAPPGRGNIGDQALVEAFVEAVGGPVVVVVRAPEDIDVPAHLADRMSLLALPALIYGTAVGRARDMAKLGQALKDAASVSIIGADIMDGAYVPRASVNRAALAERLAILGWPVRVIGFSWNASPLPAARVALSRAQKAGVTLLVRDPLSAERARRDGLEVRETADVVFLATSRDDTAVGEFTHGEPYALVNASGLVGAGESVLAEYDRIIARLRDRGLHVLVLPHVSRPGADDLPLCTAIAERAQAAGEANSPPVTLVPRLLAPSQIRALAAGATVVVTGRMHLAVMSLMAGTPAVTLATQGKVEGLMGLFSAPYLCVEPGPGLDERVIERLDRVLADPRVTRDELRGRLPEVIALAGANVDGIRALKTEVLSA
jgi:colanic acid/amylovoran biosynthesis protein